MKDAPSLFNIPTENLERNIDLMDLLSKQTFALDHYLASEYKPKENALLIRILDDGQKYNIFKFKSQYQNVLEVSFDDLSYDDLNIISKESIEKEHIKIFSEELALKIINFLNKNPNASQIVVHCNAGISRSVAVALFVAKHYFKNEELFNKIMRCKSYEPGGNKLVFDTLEKLN